MSTTPLFDVLDRMQQEAHSARGGAWPLVHHGEAPVTPGPTPAELRDQGITQAVGHADKVQPKPKWSDQAVAYCEMQIERRGFQPFLMEDLVEMAARDGVPEPPDRRAWGAIPLRLLRKGLIRRIGSAPAKTSRLGLKTLWCKAVAPRPN